MKLYVWNDPYDVKYGGSCLYAIAATEDEARKIAADAGRATYGSQPEAGMRAAQLPRDLGPPTRVHDLPYAEVYEWSE